MDDFVTTDTTPGHSSESPLNFLKRMFYETTDIIISELESRFDENSELTEAIEKVMTLILKK